MILDLIVFILVLGIVILIHEFGHFYFARKADILCHEFSIGMGPAIYQKRKGKTVYSIRAIPLGGYVAMAGEELGDVISKDQIIGLKLNDNNEVTNIILDNNIQHDFVGRVLDFDLYGENNSPLYIKIMQDGEVKKYFVKKDAIYHFKKNQIMYVTPAEESFETKTKWQRFKVIFAGPMMNFILAFVLLFFIGFFIKKPINNNYIGDVSPHISEHIKPGDQISFVNDVEVMTWDDISREIKNNKSDKIFLTINGEQKQFNVLVVLQGLGIGNNINTDEEGIVIGIVGEDKKDLININDKIIGIKISDEKLNKNEVVYEKVNNWNELINYVSTNSNQKYVYLEVIDHKTSSTKNVSFNNLKEKYISKLGVNYIEYQVGISPKTNFNLGYSLLYPFKKFGGDVKQMFVTIGLLINPKSGIGIKQLSGPVGMFSFVSKARTSGVLNLIAMMAFISINVGILNLLPIPALDGGRLTFILIEAITNKKVPKKVENKLIYITYILLLIVFLLVTTQDILRLIP